MRGLAGVGVNGGKWLAVVAVHDGGLILRGLMLRLLMLRLLMLRLWMVWLLLVVLILRPVLLVRLLIAPAVGLRIARWIGRL